MLLDLVATVTAGAGLAGVAMLARQLPRRGEGSRWLVPVAAGAGMLLFSAWNEYSWFARTTAALPAGVAILSAPADRSGLRPWTYLVPVTTRFLAMDRAGVAVSAADAAIRRAEVMIVERWVGTRRLPLAFDCRSGRQALLVEGTALAPDGTLSGASGWGAAPPDDPAQAAACAPAPDADQAAKGSAG